MYKLDMIVCVCLLVAVIGRTHQQPTQLTDDKGGTNVNQWIVEAGDCATKSDVNSDMNILKHEILSEMRNLKEDILAGVRCDTTTSNAIQKTQYFTELNKTTWADARKFCEETYGGGLVTITSEVKWQSVTAELRKFFFLRTRSCNTGFWTSGHLSNGTWIVSEGIPVVASLWYPGEPNHYDGKEECVNIWPEDNFKQNDFDCNNRLCYICEV